MLVKAVNDWESDDLVDILSSSMLKVDIRARKTASECLEQVKYLHRAPSLLRDLDRGSVTSTEVMSSSIIFEARRDLERAEGADRVNEVGSKPSLAGRASNNSQVSTQLSISSADEWRESEPIVERRTTVTALYSAAHRRSMKRRRHNESDVEKPSDALQYDSHIPTGFKSLTEVPPEEDQMTFPEAAVTMRKCHSLLDTNQS